jgi:hypothetical protein
MWQQAAARHALAHRKQATTPFCMVGHRSFLILSEMPAALPVSARLKAKTVLSVTGARISWLAVTYTQGPASTMMK